MLTFTKSYMDFLIYTGLNVLTSPMYGVEKKDDDNNHIKGNIQWEGIPIYLSAKIIYEFFEEKKIKVIPKTLSKFLYKGKKYDEYIFHIMWQSFFNSLIYNNFTEIIYDDIIVIISLFFGKYCAPNSS